MRRRLRVLRMLDAFLWLLPLKNQKIKRCDKNQFYRLFVIGKKSLPEIRKSEARASERYWARVGGIFKILMNLQKSSCQMNLEKVMQLDL